MGAADNSSGKRKELSDLRVEFEENCWRIKNTHDKYFQEAFTGFRDSKKKFCDKVLLEQINNDAKLSELEELKKKVLTVFQKGLGHQTIVSTVEMGQLMYLEGSAVLAKKVVGKDDIDIATLIRRLGNSDWIRQGLGYVTEADGQCPFCQQDFTDELLGRLNDYFDETYLNDISAINTLHDEYERRSADVIKKLEEILCKDNTHLDNAAFRVLIQQLKLTIELNQRQLEKKKKEPSAPVVLESINETATSISTIIADANASIKKHNAVVENLAAEQTALKAEIWKYVLKN